MVSGASLSRWLRVPDMVTADDQSGTRRWGCKRWRLQALTAACLTSCRQLWLLGVSPAHWHRPQRDGDASTCSVPERWSRCTRKRGTQVTITLLARCIREQKEKRCCSLVMWSCCQTRRVALVGHRAHRFAYHVPSIHSAAGRAHVASCSASIVDPCSVSINTMSTPSSASARRTLTQPSRLGAGSRRASQTLHDPPPTLGVAHRWSAAPAWCAAVK